MKKQVKIISTVLIILTILCTLSTIVMAEVNPDEIIGKLNNGSAETDKLTNVGGTIVAIMQTVGIVVAVVVLLILGIKYMMGSAEEKAEYKKTMIPYIVGAVLIFGATTIANVVFQIAQGLNTAAG